MAVWYALLMQGVYTILCCLLSTEGRGSDDVTLWSLIGILIFDVWLYNSPRHNDLVACLSGDGMGLEWIPSIQVCILHCAWIAPWSRWVHVLIDRAHMLPDSIQSVNHTGYEPFQCPYHCNSLWFWCIHIWWIRQTIIELAAQKWMWKCLQLHRPLEHVFPSVHSPYLNTECSGSAGVTWSIGTHAHSGLIRSREK